MPPLQVVLSLIGIIIIIAAAYYATYYISVKASGKNRAGIKGRGMSGNRSINLLERFAISKDKSFCIVEIAGKIYVIGVTNQSMTLLDTLDAAEFAEFEAENNNSAVWSMAPGGFFGGNLAGRLSLFIARKMRRTQGAGENAGMKNETFVDTMKSAHEEKTSGQTDRVEAEHPSPKEWNDGNAE